MYGANVTNMIIYNKSTLSQSENSVYFWVGYFCNVPIVHYLFISMLFDFKKNKNKKSCRTKNLGLFTQSNFLIHILAKRSKCLGLSYKLYIDAHTYRGVCGI